jgi:serine/threonine protein kinase
MARLKRKPVSSFRSNHLQRGGSKVEAAPKHDEPSFENPDERVPTVPASARASKDVAHTAQDSTGTHDVRLAAESESAETVRSRRSVIPEGGEPSHPKMLGVFQPGTVFGAYTIGDCIGMGGMARIYRAEHEGLQRQVALKVLTNGFAKDPERRERFLREARIAAGIKHPNVVNIFDVGVEQEIPYLVMELLEGTDLETLLNTRGALEESMILDIMVPVAAGLTAVHDAGVVHRDLKPGNIFLSRGRYGELEPKLLDFGISKASGPDHLKLTQGQLMGTPFYMAPEGLRGEDMTALSDQYSLGIVMYECATGCGPFTATTIPELFRVISTGECRPPAEHNSSLSKQLAHIITRAMNVEPISRYKDMRELGRELLQLAGHKTRITWGLSFGETDAPAAVVHNQGSQAPISRPARHTFSMFRKDVMARWAPIAIAIVFVGLMFPLLKWVNSSHDTSIPVSAPSGVVAVPNVTEWPSKSSQVPVAPPQTPIRILPEPVTHTRDLGSTARNPARELDPTHFRKRAAAEAPEWALPSTPSSQPKPSEPRPEIGSNGAPILE